MSSVPEDLQASLSQCDREPIHIPGSIQPHGMLITFSADGVIVRQVSANVPDRFARPLDGILGRPVSELLGPEGVRGLAEMLRRAGPEPTSGRLPVLGRAYEATLHQVEDVWVMELEPQAPPAVGGVEPNAAIRATTAEIRNTGSVRQLADTLVRNVRAVGGFDRVMVYRFLEDESGTVIAEDRREDLEPFLHLHYPASDIPQQARALYLRSWMRTINDVAYAPVPLVPPQDPQTGQPLHMGRCALRSVSPIHIQYLKNMEVAASISVSLIVGDRLWGLIACHHTSPWYGGVDVRNACELIGQIASLQLATLESREEQAARARAHDLQQRLVERMTQEGVVQGLSDDAIDLLDLVNATGAAIIHESRCTLVGATPTRAEVERLAGWIGDRCWHQPFATDSLSQHFPEAANYVGVASGLLAVCHAQKGGGVMLWFRPEVVQTVTWAGDPHKPVEPGTQLRPRNSFAAWQETVQGKSKPWRKPEIHAATDLRIAIMEAEVIALNADLERRVQERTEALQKAVDELNGFTYSVSHDLRTPLRGMIGNSRILVEEHGHELERPVREGLMRIESAALKMSALVESLLKYARVGRQALRVDSVDVSALARRVAAGLTAPGWPCEGAQIEVQPDMHTSADPELLETVLTTLLDNACKFRKPEETARVRVRCTDAREHRIFIVEDEGIGFDMTFAHKLFLPFERLHRDDKYLGTGIGLANAKRIVERHGGRIWAEGEPGKGATFSFTLG